jgi:DNA polymerase-3 subunit gamma/tau
MFCGSRGTGKTTCAKILAKAVNCLSPKDGEPCLECRICEGIESGKILDVSEIDAAGNNGVENIRTIKEEANFVASVAQFRVYIIDEFHMLSSGAFNALLKILEDPPPGVIFVLATTEFHKIPKTVVSRCQKFDFKRVNSGEIASLLSVICAKENIKFDQKAIDLIAKISDGSVRDALSLVDRCSKEGIVSVEYVNEFVGFAGDKSVENLVRAAVSGDLPSALFHINAIYKNGKDMIRLYEELLEFFHDVLIFNSAGDSPENCVYDRESVENSAKILGLENAIRCFDILKESFAQISKFPDKKAEIEFAVIKIHNILKSKDDLKSGMRNEGKINAKKPELEIGEINISKNAKFENSEKDVSKVAEKEGVFLQPEKAKTEKDSDDKSLASEFAKWKEVLSNCENIPGYVMSALAKAHAKIEKNVIFIEVSGNFALEIIKKADYLTEIQKSVLKITGKSFKVIPRQADDQDSDFRNKFIREARDFGIKILDK